jgi:hypothetical protein
MRFGHLLSHGRGNGFTESRVAPPSPIVLHPSPTYTQVARSAWALSPPASPPSEPCWGYLSFPGFDFSRNTSACVASGGIKSHLQGKKKKQISAISTTSHSTHSYVAFQVGQFSLWWAADYASAYGEPCTTHHPFRVYTPGYFLDHTVMYRHLSVGGKLYQLTPYELWRVLYHPPPSRSVFCRVCVVTCPGEIFPHALPSIQDIM